VAARVLALTAARDGWATPVIERVDMMVIQDNVS
jgi:hypothetical protein